MTDFRTKNFLLFILLFISHQSLFSQPWDVECTCKLAILEVRHVSNEIEHYFYLGRDSNEYPVWPRKADGLYDNRIVDIPFRSSFSNEDEHISIRTSAKKSSNNRYYNLEPVLMTGYIRSHSGGWFTIMNLDKATPFSSFEFHCPEETGKYYTSQTERSGNLVIRYKTYDLEQI